MTDEQKRIKELIESAVEEAKYPVTILGSPLKTDQTGWWKATLLHLSTDRRVEIRFEDTQNTDAFCKRNALWATELKLREMGLIPTPENSD